MLNVDEILRIPSNKLLVNLRGNKPILLNKIIYTEHELSKELKDSPIEEYTPKWTRNAQDKKSIKPKEEKQEKQKIDWSNF